MLYQGIIGGGSSPVEPVDLSPVLLWTNSNHGAAFAAQTINLDLTEYVGVIIESITDNIGSSTYIKKTETGACGTLGTTTGGGVARAATVSETNIVFGNAYGLDTVTNTAARPYKIYGVKEYVVEPVVGVLLWSNENPSAELAETQIPGDYRKYKSIIVKAKANTAADFTSESNIPKSSSTFSGGLCFYATSGANLYRAVVFTNEKITIGAGKYEAGGVSNENNSSAIPLEIYGIE